MLMPIKLKQHQSFTNDKQGFTSLLNWIKPLKTNHQQVFYCFEHTGVYSMPLALFLSKQQLPYALVSALAIKRSLGITRGKTDTIDAQRIAGYAYLRREQLQANPLPAQSIIKLKQLLSVRQRMVKQKAGYQKQIKTLKQTLCLADKDPVLATQLQVLKTLDEQINQLEQQIKQLIQCDQPLAQAFQLACSVKGIGFIVAATMLAYTDGFTGFSSWRKFACYSGIAPFEHSSGSSIKKKTRVSHLANKRIKALLTNAACSAIVHNTELRAYYKRRIDDGKSKMSTLNIVRNKLVARVFAAVNRGTPYVELINYAA